MPRCVLKDAKVNFSLVLKSWTCSDTTQRRTTKNVLFQKTIQKEYPLTKTTSKCSIKIAGCIHCITLFFTTNTYLHGNQHVRSSYLEVFLKI